MDKIMSSMIITLMLDHAAKGLRHPEHYDQATRDSIATILEDLAKQTKGMLTGELMEDAVR